MTDAVRFTHALAEREARGPLKTERLGAVQREFIRVGRRIPLDDAPFWRVFWLACVLAAIALTAMLRPAFAGFPRCPHWEMALTPWKALHLPPRDATTDAKTPAQIEPRTPKRLSREANARAGVVDDTAANTAHVTQDMPDPV